MATEFFSLYRYAVILAFDIRIERDAQEMADTLGIKIFSADIIYHLFDQFTAWREVCYEALLMIHSDIYMRKHEISACVSCMHHVTWCLDEGKH